MSLDAVAVAATARADATCGHASGAGAVMRVIIRSRQQRPAQLGGRTDHMLAVIQHQQQLPASQPAGTPASESATGPPGSSRTPRAAATASGTSAGSRTAATGLGTHNGNRFGR